MAPSCVDPEALQALLGGMDLAAVLAEVAEIEREQLDERTKRWQNQIGRLEASLKLAHRTVEQEEPEMERRFKVVTYWENEVRTARFFKDDKHKSLQEAEAKSASQVEVVQAARKQVHDTQAALQHARQQLQLGKAGLARLQQLRSHEAKVLVCAFGTRPLVVDVREARLAREEEWAATVHREVHIRRHQSATALRHLTNAKSLLTDALAYTRIASQAADNSCNIGYMLVTPESVKDLNSAKELIDGQMGVQLAKQAASELCAAQEAWQDLRGLTTPGVLFDPACDPDAALMSGLGLMSWAIDFKFQGRLKQNRDALEQQLTKLEPMLAYLGKAAAHEKQQEQAARTQLDQARSELLACRRQLLQQVQQQLKASGAPRPAASSDGGVALGVPADVRAPALGAPAQTAAPKAAQDILL